MGKLTGFMEYPREKMRKEPVFSRIKHFKEFIHPRTNDRVRTQAARCMDCGVPFCNNACPVNNLIPDFNNLVYESQWKSAYHSLISTNNFPEFTGRICPAPCEPACTVAIIDKPVAIKHIELSIIENAFKRGWVKPKIVTKRSNIKIAIIGSGPAGMAAADNLNIAGHNVVVFEKHPHFGGLLRYGIPDFKLDKSVIDRRINILKQEGIKFIANCTVDGAYIKEHIFSKFDLVCLCCGAEEQRELDIPGIKNLAGVHYAMEYLVGQNKSLHDKKKNVKPLINAHGKQVVVVGGGDTGADCVGTAIRQGAKSVTQVQLHKKQPLERYVTNPWPNWPKTFNNSSSHEEGCIREFSYLTKSVLGKNKIEALEVQKIIWPDNEIESGQRNYKLSGKTKSIACDLLISALGFRHTLHNGLVKDLDLALDGRGNLLVDNFRSNNSRIFAAGDMVDGANLVVTAIDSGRKMATMVNEHLASI
ncbi:MAG: glutamate synthase subunit beta [SAR324 cluster bacterium]|nr:glutamate synthase subunit beta [SAR324 cluster bacterium]